MKFPFQRYIVCRGKIYGSKIIGGGPAPSHLRPLFCKIVCLMHPVDIDTRNMTRFQKLMSVYQEKGGLVHHAPVKYRINIIFYLNVKKIQP